MATTPCRTVPYYIDTQYDISDVVVSMYCIVSTVLTVLTGSSTVQYTYYYTLEYYGYYYSIDPSVLLLLLLLASRYASCSSYVASQRGGTRSSRRVVPVLTVLTVQ